MVRVVPHLCRQIERDRQPRLTGREQMPEPRVRLLRGPEPGVLPHGPQLAAIHRGMDAPGERKRARSAELARRLGAPVVGTVDRLAVAHLAPTAGAAERIRAGETTSSLLPVTSGVFWCRLFRPLSGKKRQPSYRPTGGARMSGCDSRNSPIVGSRVKPCTPFPVV